MPRTQGMKTGANSPKTTFLGLPAEIRNHIYDDVCESTKEVKVRSRHDGIKILAHALACTNRQVRSEFTALFEAEALKAATTIRCYTVNLNIGGTVLREWLYKRCAVAQNPKGRVFELHTVFDEKFRRRFLKNQIDVALAEEPATWFIEVLIWNFGRARQMSQGRPSAISFDIHVDGAVGGLCDLGPVLEYLDFSSWGTATASALCKAIELAQKREVEREDAKAAEEGETQAATMDGKRLQKVKRNKGKAEKGKKQ